MVVAVGEENVAIATEEVSGRTEPQRQAKVCPTEIGQAIPGQQYQGQDYHGQAYHDQGRQSSYQSGYCNCGLVHGPHQFC